MFYQETPEARRKAARELARCHRYHLLRELEKSAALLSEITAEGIAFEEHVRGQLAELEEMFPGLDRETPRAAPDYSPNLMRDWYESALRRPERPRYEEGSFKLLNVNFMERLRYIQDPSDEGRRELMDRVIADFTRARFINRGLAFSQMIQGELKLGQLMLRRFQLLGFAPLDEYRALIERMNSAFLDASFRYYHDIAVDAQARSDRLLRNILPDSVAEKLREEKTPAPVHYDSATVVFTDFVGFSRTAGDMTPIALVEELDRCFSAFDDIIDRYGLEKLKTIGDSYMFAGGVPEPCGDHALRCIRAALEIRDYMRGENKKRPNSWSIRIGAHTGPIVAGIIGRKKFSYDIWGDAVNIASRMESTGEPDQVNISEFTRNLVKDQVACAELGTRTIKNRGEMRMFIAEGLKS